MATVANIDWPLSRYEPSSKQQSELVEYVDMMDKTHINAVMFQARTSGDAFYNSTIEPWSEYVRFTLFISRCMHRPREHEVKRSTKP